MEIKFKDNPVTIKTIEIDGKKLTKQFLQQVKFVPLEFYEKDEEPRVYRSTKYIANLNNKNYDDYSLNGTLIGYINIHLEREEFIFDFLTSRSMMYTAGHICNAYTILFLDNNGELNRSYMFRTSYHNIFEDKYPQIFI
jgi:hypothetical protein